MGWWMALALALLSSLSASSTATPIPVAEGISRAAPLTRISASIAKPGRFIDTYGRTRLFHGVNSVKKGFPWHPAVPDYLGPETNDAVIDDLARWGVSAIRLGWMWTGYEPAQGQFNATYLKIFQGLVDRLAKRGIYSLLDMHEDLLSSKFCLYDGVPLWVIDKMQKPVAPFPWPLDGPCEGRPWMENAATEACELAYQNIYDNWAGMRDDMVAFWRQSARVWAGNANVLGYELINEPFAGGVFSDPELLLPGVAGRKNLQPLYKHVSSGIRAIDNETTIFFEPVTWGMIFSDGVGGSGFTEVPGSLFSPFLRSLALSLSRSPSFLLSQAVPLKPAPIDVFCCCCALYSYHCLIISARAAVKVATRTEIEARSVTTTTACPSETMSGLAMTLLAPKFFRPSRKTSSGSAVPRCSLKRQVVTSAPRTRSKNAPQFSTKRIAIIRYRVFVFFHLKFFSRRKWLTFFAPAVIFCPAPLCQSWTEWGSFPQGTSRVTQEVTDAWSRTYPRALAGDAVEMKYDHSTRGFHLCFLQDLAVSAPTEIYVNFDRLKGGGTVQASANVRATVARAANRVFLSPSDSAKHGSKACVDINPRA
jgi:Cellulase (glycosyl hydrolase family 5)/Glycoside hydrolase family 5 C-terminal domain